MHFCNKFKKSQHLLIFETFRFNSKIRFDRIEDSYRTGHFHTSYFFWFGGGGARTQLEKKRMSRDKIDLFYKQTQHRGAWLTEVWACMEMHEISK